MKRTILYSVCIGTLALALTASGAQAKHKRPARAAAPRTAHVHTARPATSHATMSARHYNSTAQSRQRSYTRPRTSSKVVANRNTRLNAMRQRNVARNQELRTRRNVAVNRERNVAGNATRNFAYYRGRNVRINNDFHSAAFRGGQYATFRNYHRQWHDRGWWKRHYNRIVFVNGGWYFWNAGYWFPAWGYAADAYYPYDGPIYGYNGMTPDRVIVDVQQQLQRDGYYDGPIDGILGPMTREAIASFQADNGLAVTSVIDEPTLATLGVA